MSDSESSSKRTNQAEGALKNATEATEALRTRADLAGKVLAGGGSTLLTAFGIAQFSDIWPIPPGEKPAAVVGVAGFLAMVLGVLGIAYRFWRIGGSLPFRVNLKKMPDLTEDEKATTQLAYDELARLNNVTSLSAYEARAQRLERIARWLPVTAADRARVEASLIYTEILATLARAKKSVLRNRVTKAVRGRGAIALYLLFVAGVLSIALAGDKIQSERTDRITVAKACAEARAMETTVESELPDICGAPNEPTTDADETPDQTVVSTNQQLAASLTKCRKLASIKKIDPAACDPIGNAIVTLLEVDSS